jgi:uncharacterized protein (DUF433 family)
MRAASSSRRLSLKLASLVGDVPEKRIRRDLSEARLRRVGAREGFNLHETLYFSLAAHSPLGALPRSFKAELWRALTSRTRTAGNVRWDGSTLTIGGTVPTRVEATALVHSIATRYVAWRRGLRRLERDPHTLGGAVRFKGTRISVEHVGLLVNRGLPFQELREDFPSLSDEDLLFAGLYVSHGPRPGRPRKKIELRRPPS